MHKDEQYRKYVDSIDSIITALYSVISGKKNEKRNWDLFLYLFHPDAKLIPYTKDLEGNIRIQYWSPEFYSSVIGKHKETKRATGFFEVEVNKVVESYGNIAHVWSTYVCRHDESDPEPYVRGMNSFQLLFHNNRWWIVNNFWQEESEYNPHVIPEKYLP